MEKELAEKLRDAGSKLERFPSDVDQLLSLLDEIENILEKVEQSPSELIQDGYSKLMKALLAERLLRHTDADVQVSVASCISEITRITAPEAPYEDDQMKEVFQLIVSSFADLSNKSSRSYDKRASILETVAKIRSCVVMLDLECDGLISEMFQHFISSIRDDHPKNIFESMETIMTVVLEECEDVPIELLMPILASLRRENEEIPAIARKLGESVLAKCAVKLKPFLRQAVEFSNLSLDGYSKIVTTICNGSNGEDELEDVNVSEEQAGERKLTTSSDGMTQVLREVPVKSISSNGVTDTVDGDEGNLSAKPLDASMKKVDKDELGTGNLVKVDAKQETTAKKRGRKPCSTKASQPSYIDNDKEAAAIRQTTSDKEADGSPVLGKDTHDPLDEDSRASPDKEDPPLSLPELLDGEVNVSSLSPNKSVPDESPSEKVGMSKKEDALAQELASVDYALKNAIDGTSGTEIEPERHLEKKKLNLAQEDALSVDSAPAESADVNTDSEIKPQNRSEKKENVVQQHEPSKNLHAVIAAAADGDGDSEINAQELPRKNKENSGQEDKHSEDLISPKLLDGSCDSEKLSGKEKVNLSEEDLEPVSLKVDDEISDFKDKPSRRSGKKAFRTKKGRGTSKIDTEENNDEEEELTQSAKEGDGIELGTKALVQSGKEITSGRRGRPLKKSGKVDVLETNLSTKKHETTNKEGNRSDLQTDGNESGPETKAVLQSGKEKTSIPAGQPLKKSGKGYVSEAKLSGKKEDQTNINKDSPQKDYSNRTVHSKRKRTPNEKVSGDIEYGANLVGAKVKIWWPDDKQYYEGIIESFDIKKKKHKVLYTDGDKEVLVLQKEKWEFVDDAAMQEEMNEDSDPNSSSKSWKKAKRNPEQSSNKRQMGASARSGGEAAATNKAKRTVSRSGGKHGSKSKTTGRSEENWESDDESMDDVPGPAKSKPGTPKTVTKSKGKTSESGNASKGTGMAKSSLSRLKESSNSKGKSSGSGKAPETTKVKSASTSKVGKSGGKSGKKRKRGF